MPRLAMALSAPLAHSYVVAVSGPRDYKGTGRNGSPLDISSQRFSSTGGDYSLPTARYLLFAAAAADGPYTI